MLITTSEGQNNISQSGGTHTVKPFVFIGSSNEGRSVAEAIQTQLGKACETQIWDQGVFAPSAITLESLVSQAAGFDFAILVFSADDRVETRGASSNAPRDNVLIEVGLFIGAIGRQRTFVVVDKAAHIKIPSDLAGVTMCAYEAPERGTWESAVGPACAKIQYEINRQRPRGAERVAFPAPSIPNARDSEAVVESRIRQLGDNILGAEAGPPSLDQWYTAIRPVLAQSTMFTAPTYYLDPNLNILDWNVAFDLLFADIAPRIQYEHVNAFIARLVNFDEVFSHGREFTEDVNRGVLRYVHTERLMYRSQRYGDVALRKVATQLHDASGALRGWCVCLLPEIIDWPLFEKDLNERIDREKMWAVYASAYDLILRDFPPYRQLVSDVCEAVPRTVSNVIDVGAGTGNSSEALLDRGFRVTSLESSQIMIDRMREKRLPPDRHRILKGRAESLNGMRSLDSNVFDAAVLVNVLYGVDDPYSCLTGINRVVKRGGMVGLSTTHSGITLEPLLDSIKGYLKREGKFDELSREYGVLYDSNKQIQRSIARRYSFAEYCQMIRDAGFKILREEEYAYEGAVMLVHARKE